MARIVAVRGTTPSPAPAPLNKFLVIKIQNGRSAVAKSPSGKWLVAETRAEATRLAKPQLDPGSRATGTRFSIRAVNELTIGTEVPFFGAPGVGVYVGGGIVSDGRRAMVIASGEAIALTKLTPLQRTRADRLPGREAPVTAPTAPPAPPTAGGGSSRWFTGMTPWAGGASRA